MEDELEAQSIWRELENKRKSWINIKNLELIRIKSYKPHHQKTVRSIKNLSNWNRTQITNKNYSKIKLE